MDANNKKGERDARRRVGRTSLSRGWLLPFLQTVDSSFPTGAYAHSFGLEGLIDLKKIPDSDSFLSFLNEQVGPALAQQELPYMRLAFEAANEYNISELAEIDNEISAWKLTQEIRNASISQGLNRLRMLRQLYENPLIADYHIAISRKEATGHNMCIVAIQAVVHGTPLAAVLSACIYQCFGSYCAAALKLLRLGQEHCQRILCDALQRSEDLIEHSMSVARDDAGWFRPNLDIASARHATAFSRTFIS